MLCQSKEAIDQTPKRDPFIAEIQERAGGSGKGTAGNTMNCKSYSSDWMTEAVRYAGG